MNERKVHVRISTNRKYMINNIFLPLVRIKNIYYIPYFLTVVSRNIIQILFLKKKKFTKMIFKNVYVFSLSCDSLKSLIFSGCA